MTVKDKMAILYIALALFIVKRNIDCSLRKGRMVLKYQLAGLLRLRLAMTGDVPSPLAADFR